MIVKNTRILQQAADIAISTCVSIHLRTYKCNCSIFDMMSYDVRNYNVLKQLNQAEYHQITVKFITNSY